MNAAVREAIAEIKRQGVAWGTLRPELLGLALDGDLQSASECGPKRKWPARNSLFRKSTSSVPFDMPDTAFPHDGSHYRIDQLRTIWELFGITTSVVPVGNLRPLVDELVENRNAVAHGRRTPEDVGGRYSTQDIFRKIDGTRDICIHVLATMQVHCSDPANCVR